MEEKREQSPHSIEEYIRKTNQAYEQLVKERRFIQGDLMLHKEFQKTQDKRVGKLGPNYKGSYKVIKRMSNNSYAFEDGEGRSLINNWNTEHLKIYYFYIF